MIFDVDFELQATRQLPNSRKKAEKLKAFLRALRKPVEELYASNLVFRDKVFEEVSFNNQTLLFELALNTRFDPTGKGISIENTFDNKVKTFIFYRAEQEAQTHIYYRSEAQPAPIIYNRSELVSDFDFIVHVPGAINADLDEVTALIIRYNLSGKRFKIELY